MPRTGRPKAENPKSVYLRMRLDDESARKLDDYCNEKKVTRSEAVRKGIDLLFSERK